MAAVTFFGTKLALAGLLIVCKVTMPALFAPDFSATVQMAGAE